MSITIVDGVVSGFVSTVDGTISGSVSTMQTVSGSVEIAGSVTTRYTGSYEIVPQVAAQTLDTANKVMTDDLTVTAIPYYQTSNVSGDTVYIASEV